MVKALADRCAEAFAELLHHRARVAWGIENPNQFSNEELIKENYQGIRPAPGYPAQPDHTEKLTVFDLLDAEGSESSMGKRVGKDAERGKITFPTVIGKELSRKRADTLSEQATAAISGYGHAAESLSALARWIVSRQT